MSFAAINQAMTRLPHLIALVSSLLLLLSCPPVEEPFELPDPPNIDHFAPPPGGYQLNSPDLPQSALDTIAAEMEGLSATFEGESQTVKCGPIEVTVGGTAVTFSATQVQLNWHNMDVRTSFRFHARNTEEKFSMTGVYDSLWIGYVKSNGANCSLDVQHEWSDIHQFSINIKGVPGEFEQCIKEQVENSTKIMLDQTLPIMFKLRFDDDVSKECAQLGQVEPLDPSGKIGVAPDKTKTINFTIKNTGESTWKPGADLGLGLIDDNNSPCFPMAKPGRWWVVAPIAPQAQNVFAVDITGAATPQGHDCAWRMVRDTTTTGYAEHWFGPAKELRLVVGQPPIIEATP